MFLMFRIIVLSSELFSPFFTACVKNLDDVNYPIVDKRRKIFDLDFNQ